MVKPIPSTLSAPRRQLRRLSNWELTPPTPLSPSKLVRFTSQAQASAWAFLFRLNAFGAAAQTQSPRALTAIGTPAVAKPPVKLGTREGLPLNLGAWTSVHCRPSEVAGGGPRSALHFGHTDLHPTPVQPRSQSTPPRGFTLRIASTRARGQCQQRKRCSQIKES